MAMTTGGSGGLQSDINVTPLVDVVLVLLIIFMVIMPLAMRGYDVAIPSESAEPPPPGQARPAPVVLAIDGERCALLGPQPADGLPADCRVRLDDATVPVAELGPRIAELYAERERDDRVLFLAADDRLNYEGVLRVVDVAKAAVDGLRIGLVTEES